MYPLAIILGVAAFHEDREINKYAIPLAIIGRLISFYHVLEQKIPQLSQMFPCTRGIPCNQDYLNWFGFITIPMLALTAFILIFIFLTIGRTIHSHS
jgi:disulfide bond formation protein DsbB